MEPSPARSSARRVAGAAIAAAALAGCASTPPATPAPCGPPDGSGCLVDGVEVIGTVRVSADDVKERLVTSVPGGLSGLWDRLTGDLPRLSPVVLDRDLERVERFLRARGFYDARVRAGRVSISGDRARIQIIVEEGAPVVVDRREITWKNGAEPSPAARAAALGAAERADGGLAIGAPVDEEANTRTKAAIERALVDAGYAYAEVTARIQVDRAAHRAHVTYDVAPGPASTFGPVRIEGTGDFPWARIRDLVGIAEGEPYSQARIDQAVAALRRLGVFASVVPISDRSPAGAPPRPEIPLVLRVSPARPRSVQAGVGFEAGSQVEVHAVGSFEQRNLFGQLGHVSLDAKLGVVLYPYGLSTTASDAPPRALPQVRLRADLTQPLSLPSQTNALTGAAFSLYQLLPGALLGYVEVSGKAGVERSFWASAVHVELAGKIQYDLPFLYYGDPSASGSPVTLLPSSSGYRSVTVPLVELAGSLDRRRFEKDAPLSPRGGVYASAGVQLAGLDTADVRLRSEVRGYIPIPIGHHWTLAMRLRGGLLHPFGGPLAGAAVPTGGCDAADCARFLQLLQLRGFQSGGPESNRGYPYGGVGPHEPVPIPTTAPTEPFSELQGRRLLSTGGSAIWESSIDLRFPILEPFEGAVFVDASDVWRVDLPYTFAPHLSPGIEIRVLTPIGSIRGDLGLRVPGAQVLGSGCPVYDPTQAAGGPNHTCGPGRTTTSGRDYLDPAFGQAGTVAHQPLNISLSLGEAF